MPHGGLCAAVRPAVEHPLFLILPAAGGACADLLDRLVVAKSRNGTRR